MVMLASEYVFGIFKHFSSDPFSLYYTDQTQNMKQGTKTLQQAPGRHQKKKLYCIALTYNCAHLRLNYKNNKNKLF